MAAPHRRLLPFGRSAGRLRLSPILLALVLMGCGEVEPPPEAGRGADEGTRLRIDVQLTFHRGEAPVQVMRSVEIPVDGQGLVEAPEILLSEALEALVAGPNAEEREAGVHSFFSEETDDLLRSVTIEGGRAIVDFHDFRAVIPNVSASAGSMAFLTELNGTVFANSRIDEVEYRLSGSCEAFWEFLQRDCSVVPRPTEA